jgi:hypothetical protein
LTDISRRYRFDGMKVISVHVDEGPYAELQALAAAEGRPVAALVREAMESYLAGAREVSGSLLDQKPHASGRLLARWRRADLVDEMRRR